MPTKCMLILLDGLGDRAYPELDSQTPLQAACTPCLDRLAAEGSNGAYHATRQGEALPSEDAHFAILGYESRWFPGRGPLEALGAGIDLGMTDVAILSHFASIRLADNSLVLVNGKVDIANDEIDRFKEVVSRYDQDDIVVRFHHTHKGYGIVTLQGDVTPFITDTDPVIHGRPLIEPIPLAGYGNDTATCRTAVVLKKYLLNAYHSLHGLPINETRQHQGRQRVDGLVTQRAGQLKSAPTFRQLYGLKGISISSGLVYHGLCRYLGLDYINVIDSLDPGADLAQRIDEAHRILKEYDFVHVHTKVPDEAGHAKDPKMKKSAIEALDEGLARAVEPVLDDPEVFLVITADHSTPSSGRLIHSGETVPLLMLGQGIRRDFVTSYNEVSAVQGALGQVRGRELILLILNAMDRVKLQGLMDTAHNQPFWPGDIEPFRLT